MLYFDDFEVGFCSTSEQGYLLTEENVMAFAREWDPLPFHIDHQAAAASAIGELFASGAHTLAVAIKLLRTMEGEVAYIAGLGWEQVQLKLPALPGYELRLRTEVVEKRESKSKPDRGIVTSKHELVNQHGQVIVSYLLSVMVMKKSA